MTGDLYEVGFPSHRAENEFYKILSKAPKKDQERIVEWFDKLAQTPRPAGKSFKFLSGKIEMFSQVARYRVREGNWRIFYNIDDHDKRVVLLALRRRQTHTYD